MNNSITTAVTRWALAPGLQYMWAYGGFGAWQLMGWSAFRKTVRSNKHEQHGEG